MKDAPAGRFGLRLEAVRRDIRRALDIGNMTNAGALAEVAIDLGDKDPMLFCLASSSRAEAGDSRGAVRFGLGAAELAPQNALVLTTVADAMRNSGESRQAVAMFERALAIDPQMVAGWYGYALACEASGNVEGAARGFGCVIELEPTHAHGFAGLSSMQAQLGETNAARRNAEAARQRDPTGTSTLIALSRCDLAESNPQDAADRLRPLQTRPPAGFDGVIALELLGDALDRLNRTDEAFAAYCAANAQFARMNPVPDATVATTALAEHFAEQLDGTILATAGKAAPVKPEEPARHVFVLGFPRSGTTLVEQIIATADDVSTLEESPTLAAAQDRFLKLDGLEKLGRANAYELSRCRAAYWSHVREQGLDVPGRTFVDMDPFKSVSLPLIARLFPRAKIVVVRRDPRDVVWSCFRRNFVLSHATSEFTSLERAARLFSAVNRVVERSLATLPLDVHVLRYEDLVHDFDTTTRALFAFLGLEWTAGVRDFSRTAKAKQVKTASAFQVKRGLFDGTGQWRRYATHLAPAIALLPQ